MDNILIQKGATDVTLQVKLYDATNGSLKTGVTITDLDLYYIRVEDDEDVTLSSKVDLASLAALTDAHADNSGYEIGLGYYRIDLPDAIFAIGSTTGSIVILDGAGDTILPVTIDFQLVDFNPYDLKGDINAECDTAISDAGLALATDMEFVKNVLEGDAEIDITGTPWQLVIKNKTTQAELVRKDLKDVSGNNIIAVTTVIGQHKEPA